MFNEMMPMSMGGGDKQYPYAEDLTDTFQGQQDYRIDCGFQPNYVFVVGTTTTAVGNFIRGYWNGSGYEGWAGVGWRASSYLSVVTDANGCTIRFTDGGWNLGSFTKLVVVCA